MAFTTLLPWPVLYYVLSVGTAHVTPTTDRWVLNKPDEPSPPTGGPRTRSRAVLSPVGVGHSDPTLAVSLAAPGSSDLGSKPLGRLSPSWSSHGAPLCSGDVSETQTSCAPRGTGDPLLLL